MTKFLSKAAGNPQQSGGFFFKILWIITIAAFLIRMISAWEMASAAEGINNVLSPLPTSDLATYMTLGERCARGEFPETFYYQPYYYSVFLAVCYFFASGKAAIWLTIVMQALLSSATVFLAGWCGKKIFSDARGGIFSAFLCAVSSSLILYVPFTQNETLQAFHLVSLLAVIIVSLEKNKAWLWAVSGIIAGISILTRGNIWLFLPLIFFVLSFFEKRKGVASGKRWMHAGIFTFCLLAVQLPFIIRNSLAAGELSGPSTAANAVLALGNTPEAPAGGREPGSVAGSMAYPESYHRMMANTQGEFSRSVPLQMWDWFLEDPAAFIELQFRKALLFWDGREIPNNVSLDYDGIMCSKILKYLVIGRNSVLFSLGIAGILFFLPALRKKEAGFILLYGFTLIFYISIVVFYILSRFKAPVIPLLAIFGGCAASAWITMFKESKPEKKVITVGKILIYLLVGIWFSSAAYNIYRDCEAAINRWLYPDGIILDMHGKNIQHIDHGPLPFGGWSDIELKPGMTITKQFSRIGTSNAEISMMVRSFELSTLTFTVNGLLRQFSFPPATPGSSGRRMLRFPGSVMNGITEIQIISITGGEVWGCLDIQRNYSRSMFNGSIMNGEWVIRAGVPR